MKNLISKIFVLGAVGYSLLLRSDFEKKNFKIVNYKIEDRKLSEDIKIVFLTDLHNNSFGRENEKLLAAIDEISPDFVLIGGDLITVKRRLRVKNALNLMKKLSEKYLCIYANGNHEQRLKENKFSLSYYRYKSMLKSFGVRYLSNESMDLRGNICIHGLNLEKKYYLPRCKTRLSKGYIENRLSLQKVRFNILLAHSPLFIKDYAGWGADLTLCGHYHGGTVRLPGGIGLMTPQYQFFSRLVSGMRRQGGMREIIGSGLGTHSINLRLNDMSELVVIHLTSANSGQTYT